MSLSSTSPTPDPPTLAMPAAVDEGHAGTGPASGSSSPPPPLQRPEPSAPSDTDADIEGSSSTRPASPGRSNRRRSKSPPSSKLKAKAKSTARRHSRSRSPAGVAKKTPGAATARGSGGGGGFLSRSRRAMVAAWVKVTRLGGSLLGSASSPRSGQAATPRAPATAATALTAEHSTTVAAEDQSAANATTVAEQQGPVETSKADRFETAIEEQRQHSQDATKQPDDPVAPENTALANAGDGEVSLAKTAPTPKAVVPESVDDSPNDNDISAVPTKGAPVPVLEAEAAPETPATTLLDLVHIDPIWHRLALTYLPPHMVTRLRRVCRYLHDLIDQTLPVTHWLPTPALRQRMLHSLAAAGYAHGVLLERLVPRTPNGILARPARQAWPALAAAVRGKHPGTVETLLKLEPRAGAVGKLICPPPRALTSKGLHKVSVVADAAARSDAATLRALLFTCPGAGSAAADHWIPVPATGRVLKSALMCAIEAGNLATAQVLRELGAQWSPRSLTRPRPDRRRRAKMDGGNGDEQQDKEMGAVCIGLAVLSGSVNMLKWVLANVHTDAIRTRPPWVYRMALLENLTPLMLAVTSDSLEMVQVMLAAGAPVVMEDDAKDHKSTPPASEVGGEKVRKALQALPSWVYSNPLDLATTKKSRAPVFTLLVEAHRKQACGNVMHQCSFYQSDYKLAAALAATSATAATRTVAPPMHESFLACAVRRGNVVLVKAALEMGAQVSVPGRPWVKPEEGSKLEHCPIAGYRYAALDDCNAMGYFLLCLAVKGGHDEVATVLREHLADVSGGVATIPWNMDVPEAAPPVADATTAAKGPGDVEVTPASQETESESAADQPANSESSTASQSKSTPPATAPAPSPSSPLHGEPLYGKTPLHLALERPVAQWDDAGIDRMLDEGAWMHVLDDQGYAPLDIALRGAGVNHSIVKRMVAMMCASPEKVAAGFATLSVLIHAAVIAATRDEMKKEDWETLTGLLAARPVECKEEQGKEEGGQLADVRKRFGGVSQVAGMVDAGLLPVDVELQNFPMYLEREPFSPIPPLIDPPAQKGPADAESQDSSKSAADPSTPTNKTTSDAKGDDDDDNGDASSLCSGCGRRHDKEKKEKAKTPKTPETDLDLSQPFYAGLATPLFRAIVSRNMGLVRLLLKHGAHPNVGLEHAHLSWAAQRNHVSSTIRSPLAQAVYMGDLDMVRELLAHGAATREGEYDLTQCSVSSKHEKNSTCRVTVLMIALYLRAVARDLEESGLAKESEEGDQKENGPSTPSRNPMSKSPLLLAANQPPPALLPPLPSVVRTPPAFAPMPPASSDAVESSGALFTFTPSSPVKSMAFTSPPLQPSTPTPSTPGGSSRFLTPTSVLESNNNSNVNSSPLMTPATPPAAHSTISLVAPPASAIPRLTDAIKRYSLTVAQLDAVIAELRARNAPITWTRLPCPRLCRKSEQFRLVRGDDLNDTVKCAEECMRHTNEMSLTEKAKAGTPVDGGKRSKARSRKVSTGRARVSALPGSVAGSKSPASLPSVGSSSEADGVPPLVAEDGTALPLLTSAAIAASSPFAFSFSWANVPDAATASSSTSSSTSAPPALAPPLFTFGGSTTPGFSFKYTLAPVEVDGATVPLPASPVLGGSISPTFLAVLDIPLPPSPMMTASNNP